MTQVITSENLRNEMEDIYTWMNETRHPSEFRIWSDYVSNLSKEWTVKENRLKEIKKELGIK